MAPNLGNDCISLTDPKYIVLSDDDGGDEWEEIEKFSFRSLNHSEVLFLSTLKYNINQRMEIIR